MNLCDLRSAAAGIVALLLHAPAVADSACMTVTQDTVLHNDFSCDCSNGSAIEVQQLATLDLNGYQASCAQGNRSTSVVRLTGQGARLLNGSVRGQVNRSGSGGCITMEGLHQTVAGVKVEHCHWDCIEVYSNAHSANITANWFRWCGMHGILANGPSRILISGNDVSDCGSNGISLTGSNATVVDNYVAEVGYSCIEAYMTDGMFENNKVIDCHEDGIAIRKISTRYYTRHSVNNQIKKNVVSCCGGHGIRIEGGDYNLASGNFVEGSGVFVWGDGNSIERNKLHHTPEPRSAIEVAGKNNVVETNSVSDAGGSCLAVDGDNTTVRCNDLKYCGGDGIAIHSNLNTVTGNNVTYCNKDGIAITRGNNNNTFQNKVESISAVAFHDVTGNNDCGTNRWKQNEGRSFEPRCTGNYASSPRSPHNHLTSSATANTVVQQG